MEYKELDCLFAKTITTFRSISGTILGSIKTELPIRDDIENTLLEITESYERNKEYFGSSLMMSQKQLSSINHVSGCYKDGKRALFILKYLGILNQLIKDQNEMYHHILSNHNDITISLIGVLDDLSLLIKTGNVSIDEKAFMQAYLNCYEIIVDITRKYNDCEFLRFDQVKRYDRELTLITQQFVQSIERVKTSHIINRNTGYFSSIQPIQKTKLTQKSGRSEDDQQYILHTLYKLDDEILSDVMSQLLINLDHDNYPITSDKINKVIYQRLINQIRELNGEINDDMVTLCFECLRLMGDKKVVRILESIKIPLEVKKNWIKNTLKTYDPMLNETYDEIIKFGDTQMRQIKHYGEFEKNIENQ